MASAEFYIDQWTERFLFRLNEFINFSTDCKNEWWSKFCAIDTIYRWTTL